MLVLSRRTGESFLIGDDVEVVILGLDGGHVRVGIRAPKEILIVRKELIEIRARNAAALALPSPERLHASLLAAERLLKSRDGRGTESGPGQSQDEACATGGAGFILQRGLQSPRARLSIDV